MDVTDLLGRPFKLGGRGPENFDCYGLVMELFKRQGISLPDYVSPDDRASISALITCELRLWERCESAPGTLVVLRVPGNMHCGYTLSRTQFVHAWEQSGGVVKEHLSEWQHTKRVLGFYRYVGQTNG